ncbi:MAG: glycosyltransferase [Ardenticatenales bacterium]|nr:glycosyltransferase [Ardenticatenales bacterium]
MNFLFLTPQLPYPPRQGAAIRNWGIMSELATRHEVHLLSFGESGEVTPPGLASLTLLPSPTRTTATRLRELLTSTEPDIARRLASPDFAVALARLLEQHRFDVVQVEGLELVPYALPYLPALLKSGRAAGSVPEGAAESRGRGLPKWVYDAHNAESDLQRSALLADARQPRRWHAALYSALQTMKLQRYEAKILPRFGQVVAVSESDAAFLRGLSGVRPLVIPNGINTEALTPTAAPTAAAMQARPGPTLLFTGKMDFRPNVDGVLWFVDEILPRLKLDGPPATLWVVGQSLHPALERLRDDPQVVLTGWVDAVEPYLAAADVVVVPLRMGSGTRLKVLQALSMARPLVGTTLGCAGLALRDGVHLRLADSPESFAAAITELLRDPSHALEMGNVGRSHVQAHFDWRVLVPQLEEALR